MNGAEPVIAVLGGTSPLVPYLVHHLPDDQGLALLSRRPVPNDDRACTYDDAPSDLALVAGVSLMPIWELPTYFPWLQARGCVRLVALSSTSRFTKTESARPHDRELAARLARGEQAAEDWARSAGVALTILRPTMVYGGPSDGNVSELASILRRFRVVPLVGPGDGLRQPIHMSDVAAAIASAVQRDRTEVLAYDLSGGEVLTYRQLLDRIRATVPGPTGVLRVPGLPFAALERVLPRSRRVSLAAGMVERMGSDMVFDHTPAAIHLGHAPRRFEPGT